MTLQAEHQKREEAGRAAKQANAKLKRKGRRLDAAGAATTARLQKTQKKLKVVTEETQKMRDQRDKTRAEKREWKKKADDYERAVKAAKKRAAVVESEAAAAERGYAALAVEVGDLESELHSVTTALLAADKPVAHSQVTAAAAREAWCSFLTAALAAACRIPPV
jgi:chromosome segregation ATPase